MSKRRILFERISTVLILLLTSVATIMAVEVLAPEIAYLVAKAFHFLTPAIIEAEHDANTYGFWAILFCSIAAVWGWCFTALSLKIVKQDSKEVEEETEEEGN